jgi:hypothetical protein
VGYCDFFGCPASLLFGAESDGDDVIKVFYDE